MSDVIRRGKIIIDFETGSTSIKVPDLSGVVANREKELTIAQELDALYSRIAKATEEAAAAQQAAAGGGSGPGGGDAGGGVERQQRTLIQQLKTVEQLSGGFLRLTRAAVLFGSDGDQSMRRFVQSLATVQAGIDLLKGSIAVMKALTAATQAQAAASTAAAAASTAQGTAAAGAGAAMASVNPIVAAGVAIVTAGLVVWKLWTDRTREQTEAERALRQSIEDRNRAVEKARRDAETSAAASAEAFIRANETTEDKLGLFLSRQSEIRREASYRMRDQSIYGGGEQNLAIQIERDQKIAELAKERNDALIRQGEQQSRLIEQRQRELELAQKLLDVEKEKVESFQAQFGALNAGQRNRLERIADKVRAGGQLNRRELEILQEQGGDQGESIARDIYRRRGVQAGADRIFRGISVGAPGMTDAQAAVDAALKARDQATGGKSADAALAEIKAAKEATEKQFAQFLDNLRRMTQRFEDEQARQRGEIKAVKAAAERQAAQGRR